MKTDLPVQYQIGSYHEEVNIYITPHSSMCLNAVSGIPIWFMGHEMVTFLTLPGESPEAGVSLQYIHRIYVYIPIRWKTSDQWKLKGSNWIMFVAISRTDCDFSVHTNSLHIESARSQPWFIDSENEWKKKENQREKPKTLLTMTKVVKWINVRIGNSLKIRIPLYLCLMGWKECCLSINKLSRYPLIRGLRT